MKGGFDYKTPMTKSRPDWEGSPEERIIREIFFTKKNGLEPGTRSTEYGRVLETVLIRELQMLAREQTDTDLRFARGYVVEDYGNSESGTISADGEATIDSNSPRFDIVCYCGDVAWSAFDGNPVAVVPKSFTYGVIEVKRTLSPGFFPGNSSRALNTQFRKQRGHLDSLGLDVPFIVVGAHFRGTPKENRRKALADHVALLGDLSHEGSAAKMARSGELSTVIDVLAEGTTPENADGRPTEKVSELQDIAKEIHDSEGKGD